MKLWKGQEVPIFSYKPIELANKWLDLAVQMEKVSPILSAQALKKGQEVFSMTLTERIESYQEYITALQRWW